MKKIFRLYNSLSSSYFNLIEGDTETKQTKGLGLLLSKSTLALDAFFEVLKRKDGSVVIPKYNSFNKLIVDCEKLFKFV